VHGNIKKRVIKLKPLQSYNYLHHTNEHWNYLELCSLEQLVKYFSCLQLPSVVCLFFFACTARSQESLQNGVFWDQF